MNSKFYIILLSLVFLVSKIKAQESKDFSVKDTLYVLYGKASYFYKSRFEDYGFISKDTCYIRTWNKIPKDSQSIKQRERNYRDIIDDHVGCRIYSIFKTKRKGRLIAEGIREQERFCYKMILYYRNGKKRVEGYYPNGDYEKGGIWTYYNKKGNIIRHKTISDEKLLRIMY